MLKPLQGHFIKVNKMYKKDRASWCRWKRKPAYRDRI